MKIAINHDWGGFGLSELAYQELGLEWDGFGYISNEDLEIESDNQYAYRADPRLIAAVEKLGTKLASGGLSHVVICEIPDDVNWEIHDYDGMESIHEVHRSW